MPITTTITLIQVSDIHWEYNNPSLFSRDRIMADQDITLRARHNAFVEHLHRVAKESAEKSSKTFLVLGGDHVYQSNYEINNIECLGEKLVMPTINLKAKSGKNVFDGVVVVPGNHDIFDKNRADEKRKRLENEGKKSPEQLGDPFIDETDKFCRFKLWCSNLQQQANDGIKVFEPFSSLYLRLPIHNGKCVLLYALNSSGMCGSLDSAESTVKSIRDELKGKMQDLKKKSPIYTQLIKELSAFLPTADSKGGVRSYDPGWIDPDDVSVCENRVVNNDDIFRIAILHHNNLPTNNDDNQKYRFLNSGWFNNALLRLNFRLVLHGHQHIGEVANYAKFRHRQQREIYTSYLTDGFLAVGAPAFDIGAHHSDHRGFNVITLSFSDETDICSIQVDRHLWQINQTFEVVTTYNEVALRDAEDKERLNCLSDVNRVVFSNRPIRGITRGLDNHKYKLNHAESIREKVEDREKVRAMYALSAFEPGYWLSSKLMGFLLPLGVKNMQMHLGSGAKAPFAGGHVPIKFKFSKPLVAAIKRAASNALLVNRSKNSSWAKALARNLKVDCNYRQAYDFVTARVAGFEAGVCQMSVFGQAVSEKADFITPLGCRATQLEVSKSARRPFARFSGDQKEATHEVKKIFEFPRIVMWEPDEFMRPSTLDIIDFHENLGFPLFWIDPSLLVSKAGKRRERIGSVSILSYDFNDSGDQQVSEHLHKSDGARLSKDEFVERVWHEANPFLWPLDKREMGLENGEFITLRRSDCVLHEFIWMLGHPAICFAADAWAAAYLGEHTFRVFRNHLRDRFDLARNAIIDQ